MFKANGDVVKLLTNTGFPVTLVTIIALALERAHSVLASGLWRAVVLVFAALIHVFEESDKISFATEKVHFRGWNPAAWVSPMFTCFQNRPLSIGYLVTRYSHLPHNCCLWIPVGIHTCSLSGRSHSGKIHHEGRCCFCKRSVGIWNELYLNVSFHFLLYFLPLDKSYRIYWS